MSGLNRKGWQTAWAVRELSTLEESFLQGKKSVLKEILIASYGYGTT